MLTLQLTCCSGLLLGAPGRQRPRGTVIHMSASGSEQPLRVAVVGGGLAGLGFAFHLVNSSSRAVHLDVHDPADPGCGGASAVAAGLLHPFRPNGHEIWMGTEGFAATSELVRAVEQATGEAVSASSGLLRLAMDDKQADELREAAAAAHPADAMALRWHTTSEATQLGGGDGVGGLGAAFAPAALTVDTPRYLQGLWRLCEQRARAAGGEASWRHHGVGALSELVGSYDAIVVAAGACTPDLTELRGRVPLRPCRGHNLYLRNEAQLRTPLICGKYLVPLGASRETLVAGATFEYGVHEPPQPAEAEGALRPQLAAMHPPAASLELIDVRAGVRALPPRSHHGYVPLCGEIASGVWLLSGFGSRGLIHHALLGRATAHAVLANDAALLPEHTRRLEGKIKLELADGDDGDG